MQPKLEHAAPHETDAGSSETAMTAAWLDSEPVSADDVLDATAQRPLELHAWHTLKFGSQPKATLPACTAEPTGPWYADPWFSDDEALPSMPKAVARERRTDVAAFGPAPPGVEGRHSGVVAGAEPVAVAERVMAGGVPVFRSGDITMIGSLGAGGMGTVRTALGPSTTLSGSRSVGPGR